MAQIHLENLTFRYSGSFCLDIQSCRFGGSEAGVISGPSGAGKTTLMRVLAGILKTGQGQRRIEDAQAGKAGNTVFLAETPGMLSWITDSILDEFRLLAEFRGLRDFRRAKPEQQAATVSALLSRWNIPAEPAANPRTLSLGSQNLLVMCMAEFCQAPMVLIDGMIEVLAPVGIRSFIAMIDRLRNAGRAIYICTNETERFLAHMDRMMLLKDGKLILDALPERVLPFLDAHGLKKPGIKLKEMSWAESGD